MSENLSTLDDLNFLNIFVVGDLILLLYVFHYTNDANGKFSGIDTDKNKYPIGSGRVTFNNYDSYVRAVQAAFVNIKTPKFSKKVSCGSAGEYGRNCHSTF